MVKKEFKGFKGLISNMQSVTYFQYLKTNFMKLHLLKKSLTKPKIRSKKIQSKIKIPRNGGHFNNTHRQKLCFTQLNVTIY